MRWIPFIVITTVASAQATLRSCLLSTMPLDATGTNDPQARPTQYGKQRNACIADRLD